MIKAPDQAGAGREKSMKYYKVRKEYDQTQVLKTGRHGLKIDRVLVGNELYTPEELKKLLNGATLRGIRDNEIVFDPVEVNRNDTYTFFGARFS